MKEPNLLFYTSFVFLTNVFSTLSRGYPLYAILFSGLFLTSLVVHTTDTMVTNIADKILCTCIVVYGGFILWIHGSSKRVKGFASLLIIMSILSLFFWVVNMYVLGYWKNSGCFSLQLWEAKQYHMTMHFVSSIGHHLICLL